MAPRGKESDDGAVAGSPSDAPSQVRRSWDSIDPEALEVALGSAAPPREARETPRPPGGASLWIAIALPEQNASGQLVSTIAQRLSKAGFNQHSYQPSLFLRHAIANPKALALMIEALVGKAAVWGMQMAVLGGEAEPTLTDVLTQLESLPRAIVRLKAQWLMPLVLAKKVFSHLQPVFDQRGQVFAEEALARADLGDRVETGSAVIEAAEELDVAASVDRLVRIDAFRGLSSSKSEKPRLVLHVSGATLKHPAALVASVLELARTQAGRALADAPGGGHGPESDLVLCIPQRLIQGDEREGFLANTGLSSAITSETGSVLAALDLVRRSARFTLAVALSRDATSASVAELFRAVRPAIVKIDASSEGFSSLCDEVVGRGAVAFASKLETPAALRAAESAGATLFSGHHLGRPRRLGV